MKRLVSIITMVAASVIISSVPVLAAEGTMGSAGGRDECLLVSSRCTDNVDSIQQKIDRLHKEINKGTNVYTHDELIKLNDRLDDSVKMLEILTIGA